MVSARHTECQALVSFSAFIFTKPWALGSSHCLQTRKGKDRQGLQRIRGSGGSKICPPSCYHSSHEGVEANAFPSTWAGRGDLILTNTMEPKRCYMTFDSRL